VPHRTDGSALLERQILRDAAELFEIILVFQSQADRFDFLVGAMRETGDPVMPDLPALAIGLAQVVVGIALALAGSFACFDVHIGYIVYLAQANVRAKPNIFEIVSGYTFDPMLTIKALYSYSYSNRGLEHPL